MKNLVLVFLMLCSVHPIGAEKAEAKRTQVQLQQKMDRLQGYASTLDNRINKVSRQAMLIDERSEAITDNTLKLFQKVRDSRETGNKVIRHKKDLIEDLEKSIKVYEEILADVNKKMTVSGVNYGLEFVKFHEWINKRITKRITQIKSLAKTFEGYKDHYDYNYRGSYVYNWERDYQRQKERKMARRGDKERGEVVKDMNKAIKILQDRIKVYEKQMSSAWPGRKVDVLSRNVKAAYDRIGQLESSIQDLLTGYTDTKKIGRRAERNISKQLRLNAKELKSNMQSQLSHFRSIISLAEKRARLRYDTLKTEKALEKTVK